MPLTIKQMLEVPSLAEATLLSGKQGINQNISNIMVMEAPDVEHWLAPGQVILSSLFSLQDATDKVLGDFIKELSIYKASGLIIKKNRFVEYIPEKIIDACNENGLPLIQISGHIKYNDIILDVMHILFNEKAGLLDYYHNIHHQFTKIALEQPTLLDIAQVLKQLIHNPITLLDFKKNPILGTDKVYLNVVIHDSIPLKRESYMNYSYNRRSVSIMTDREHFFTQLIVKISNIGNDFYYLVINEVSSPLGVVDFLAIENAVSFLQMELIKQFAISEVRQNYRNDIIDDLFSDKFTTKERLYEAAESLDLSADRSYRVVVLQIIPAKKRDNFDVRDKTISKQYSTRLVKKLQLYWSDLVYRIRSNRIILILNADSIGEKEFKSNIKYAIQSFLKEIEPFSNIYRVGISDNSSLEELSRYSLQALKIVQYASFFKKSSFIFYQQDLGFYQYLSKLSHPEKISELIPEKLDFLQKNSPELVETLRVFLDHNQNLTKCADVLYLHPKTVRYRINKIQKLTDINFSDPDELLYYNIGMRIVQVLESQPIED